MLTRNVTVRRCLLRYDIQQFSLLPKSTLNILTVNPFVRKLPENISPRRRCDSDISHDIDELAFCVSGRMLMATVLMIPLMIASMQPEIQQ